MGPSPNPGCKCTVSRLLATWGILPSLISQKRKSEVMLRCAVSIISEEKNNFNPFIKPLPDVNTALKAILRLSTATISCATMPIPVPTMHSCCSPSIWGGFI